MFIRLSIWDFSEGREGATNKEGDHVRKDMVHSTSLLLQFCFQIVITIIQNSFSGGNDLKNSFDLSVKFCLTVE